jgi:hypothetical protein
VDELDAFTLESMDMGLTVELNASQIFLLGVVCCTVTEGKIIFFFGKATVELIASQIFLSGVVCCTVTEGKIKKIFSGRQHIQTMLNVDDTIHCLTYRKKQLDRRSE